jgi:L-ascorbate 6-phosphate lactonase
MQNALGSNTNLLEQIENSPKVETARIWALTGAGFVIRYNDDVLYVDPWLVTDPKRTTHRTYPIPFPPESVRKCNAVISTHEHEDHCNVATVKGIVNSSGATFVGPKSAVSKVAAGGLPESSTLTVKPGSFHKISPSLNIRVFESQDPYEPQAVMIMIETPRGNILHSGDTSYFPGFKEIGEKYRVEVALLNFGKQIPTPEKPYYMDAEKVALAAKDLRARIIVPMHWNLWEETREDPRPIGPILKAATPSSELRILEGGELLTV